MAEGKRILHVRLTVEDHEHLDALASSCGRPKSTLAGIAVGVFVRNPAIRAVLRLEDAELGEYIARTPAALELLSRGMARGFTDEDWQSPRQVSAAVKSGPGYGRVLKR